MEKQPGTECRESGGEAVPQSCQHGGPGTQRPVSRCLGSFYWPAWGGGLARMTCADVVGVEAASSGWT